MRETQRMANLVSRHKADQLTHNFVIKLYPSCCWIYGSSLHEEPVTQQVHYVVIPPDIALKNLSGPWIMHMRPVGVLNIRSEIADHGITDIFRTPLGIFFFRGRIFGDNSIFKARSLKSFLPIYHTLFQVRPPFIRCGRVNPVHNRIHRLHQLTAHVGFLVFGNQFVTGDKPEILGFLCVVAVVGLTNAEEPNPLVVRTRTHLLLWQQNHAVIHLHGDGVGLRVGRWFLCLIRQYTSCFNIERVAVNMFNKRSI